VFELLTGDYLFDPKEHHRAYKKDEDHVAQMMELLGDFPPHFLKSGVFSNEIFNSRGMFAMVARNNSKGSCGIFTNYPTGDCRTC
jgi:serine/threonine-protein kinase SRPK3